MTSDASWIGSMPEVYDRALGPVLFTPFAQHLADVVAAQQPERVLELAAGTGIATAELVRALPDARVTATDLNPAMVSWAAERVPAATWRQAGGLRAGSVDRVVLRGTAPTARSAAEGFCLGTPLRFALQERGPLEELVPRIADEMTARLGEGPVDTDLAAYVVTARHPA